MGIFKKIREKLDDAQQQIKDNIMEKIEDAQQQIKVSIDNSKKQMFERAAEFLGEQRDKAEKPEHARNSLGQQRDEVEKEAISEQKIEPNQNLSIDQEYEEKKVSRPLGNFENGILEVFEGTITIDSERLEDYNDLRKIIFPASLENVESYLLSDCEKLEEVDFSKVSRLEEIPDNFIHGKNLIKSFIIPYGVKYVGSSFFFFFKPGTEIYVPDSVNQIGYICEGDANNEFVVYIYAANLNLSKLEQDADLIYVLPQYFLAYSAQLKEYHSRARLLAMPADKINLYNNNELSQINENVSESQEPVGPILTEPQRPVASENESKKDIEKVGSMFSERIENLITAALQDGVLTDKEEEILKRRVEKEGEDWDEVEMYIQSLLQKRQQEMNKEIKTTQQIQELNDENNEQKHSETLRKCPKCGSYIPHLSNVCPDCGFIIEKNDTDKKITILVSLLRFCIDHLSGLSGAWGWWRENKFFEIQRSTDIMIKKEDYNYFPSCYIIHGNQSGVIPGFFKADYNWSGIVSEAYSYSNNDTVNSLLLKLHRKEKDTLIAMIESAKGEKYEKMSILNVSMKIKDYYDIMDDSEILKIENSLRMIKIRG